ncbi:MAG: 16S rRNA (guanine(966)-N(2))-methyltransferase RsmD [Bacteroidetes bacterium]|nr:16S rRNA (guanine(966)-N(2))-methyltransferase RsmD [Bacteroidota bacterium]
MRIIGGLYKGRRLHPPNNLPVRPTTDLARESLFNILNNRIDFEGLRVLDLFAGTGSISFEFASRGAAEIIAIDRNPQCLTFILQTANLFGIENIKVLKGNVLKWLPRLKGPFDIIFADPPYDMKELPDIPQKVLELNLLDNEGIFIMEHDARHLFNELEDFRELRKYGKVHFSFFTKIKPDYQ